MLEQRIAALEGGTAALAVASGHAAQVLVFHTLMEPGDEFVAGRQLYGGSVNQFNHSFKKFNWNVAWADATDPASFAKAITPKTKAIFCESIANPGGIVVDLPAIAAIAKKAGVPFIVDNTLATPYLCRPKEHGADIIVHSLTKFMGGHGNSIGGVIVDCGTYDWLGAKQEVHDAGRAQPQLQRHAAGRDLRQLRLRHRLPRHGPARPGPGDLALQRVPDPDRHRDAAAAHGQALRERARRRQASGEAQARSRG